MKNTLKFVLIIIGLILIGYGLCIVFFPDVFSGNTTIEADSKAQPIAMIGLGVLALLSGLAFRKR